MNKEEKDEGIHIPGKRYAFTNINDEVFESKWDGISIKVEPKETIEISDITPLPSAGAGIGHALNEKMTKEMVDGIFQKIGKKDEDEVNQPYFRSRITSQMAIPSLRKKYEDQISRELDPLEEGPALQSLRKQFSSSLVSNIKKTEEHKNWETPQSLDDFAQIEKSNAKIKETPKAVTKKIKA